MITSAKTDVAARLSPYKKASSELPGSADEEAAAMALGHTGPRTGQLGRGIAPAYEIKHLRRRLVKARDQRRHLLAADRIDVEALARRVGEKLPVLHHCVEGGAQLGKTL